MILVSKKIHADYEWVDFVDSNIFIVEWTLVEGNSVVGNHL